MHFWQPKATWGHHPTLGFFLSCTANKQKGRKRKGTHVFKEIQVFLYQINSEDFEIRGTNSCGFEICHCPDQNSCFVLGCALTSLRLWTFPTCLYWYGPQSQRSECIGGRFLNIRLYAVEPHESWRQNKRVFWTAELCPGQDQPSDWLIWVSHVEFRREQEARLMWSWIKRWELDNGFYTGLWSCCGSF